MNKENTSKLWKMIQEAGDYLQGQLPDHPNHPKGRNPYAHIAICVRSKFQKSYKDNPESIFTPLPRNITPLGIELDPTTGADISKTDKE